MKSKLFICLLSVSIIALFACNGIASINTEKEKDEKKSKQGWLGAQIQDVTAKLAKSMDLKVKEGVLVNKVTENSPAEKAGIKDEDVILEVAGKKIADANALVKAVRAIKPDTKVDIVLMRKNEKKTVQAVIGAQPNEEKELLYSLESKAAEPFQVFMNQATKPLGLQLIELNDQLAEYFEAPDGGVLVESVKKKSEAEKSGFKAGDVIVKAGKKIVDEVSDIHKAMSKLDDGDTLTFEVIRKGVRKSLSAVIEKNDEHNFFNYNFNVAPYMKMFKGQMPPISPSGLNHIYKYKIGDDDENDNDEEIEIEGLGESLDHLGNDIEKSVRVYIDSEKLKNDAKELEQQAKDAAKKIKKNIQIKVKTNKIDDI